jgi:hypothetical protein
VADAFQKPEGRIGTGRSGRGFASGADPRGHGQLRFDALHWDSLDLLRDNPYPATAEGAGMLDLINWILEEGRDNDDLGAILEKFSEWLVARGIPVCRTSLIMPTIDPAAAGAVRPLPNRRRSGGSTDPASVFRSRKRAPSGSAKGGTPGYLDGVPQPPA